MTDISNEISADEFAVLCDGDLSEVCELHSRGTLIEVIAVHVGDVDFCDGDSFEGCVVAVGPIDGAEDSHEGLHNVTCIGGTFTRLEGNRYYAFNNMSYGDDNQATQRAAVAFAVGELTKLDMPYEV